MRYVALLVFCAIVTVFFVLFEPLTTAAGPTADGDQAAFSGDLVPASSPDVADAPTYVPAPAWSIADVPEPVVVSPEGLLRVRWVTSPQPTADRLNHPSTTEISPSTSSETPPATAERLLC